MNIRHLKVFITVVDTGSMTNAAEKLFVAQPSISQTIKEIEEYYNIRLFERLSKKLYITEKGKEFLSYARHIVSLFDEMEEKIRQNSESGILRIGASITVGTCILSQLSSRFIHNYANIHIESVIDNTMVVEDMVLKSRLDFGLVEGPIHSEYIISKPFMDDELILICGREHPFREKPYITLQELSQSDLILRESGSGTRELFENFMASKGFSLNIKWVCNNSEAIKNAVISNIGVSVISKMAVENELASNKLFHIELDDIKFKRQFNIIYHKNKYITESMEAFWNLCYTEQRR